MDGINVGHRISTFVLFMCPDSQDVMTHSLIFSAPSGTRRDSKGSPYGSFCCRSGCHFETQSPDIEVYLHGAPPCLLSSSHLSHAQRCPSESFSGDGVVGHAEDISPPPTPPCSHRCLPSIMTGSFTPVFFLMIWIFIVLT